MVAGAACRPPSADSTTTGVQHVYQFMYSVHTLFSFPTEKSCYFLTYDNHFYSSPSEKRFQETVISSQNESPVLI